MSATAPVDARPVGGPPGTSRSVRFWYGYARLVVATRWLVVVAWLIGAVAVVVLLRPFEPAAAGTLEDIGAGDASIAAEQRSTEVFGFPLLSRVAIVQHDADGMEPLAQAEAVARALAVNQGAHDTEVLGAVPVPSGADLLGAESPETTVLTWLFVDPTEPFHVQRDVAEQFADAQLTDADDAYVGVTGSVPARVAQAEIVADWVHVVEVATLVAVLLVVALTFRSFAAPLVTLVAVGTGVVVTLGVARSLSASVGLSVPPDLRPLIVALLLGVVTDYCIFYLSGMRSALAAGYDRLEAARRATASTTPIVLVAGLTVAAGTASLVVASSGLFSAFGPGLALTVLIGLVVSVTFVPAVLAIAGGWVFRTEAVAVDAAQADSARTSGLTLALTRRGSALLVAVLCIAGLGAAASFVRDLDLGLGFVQSLPGDDPVAAAAAAASEGFADGIVSPTELLLEADGVGADPDALAALGEGIAAHPGVAGVLGPGTSQVADDLALLVAEDGGAVRYLVVLDDSPLEATAIDNLAALTDAVPELMRDAGLGEATIGVAGDTALAAGIIQGTTDDLLRIAVAALAANLLMLVLFLRALVAPLYLLACSVLALSAALGLGVLLFQGLLGQDDMTFYVPFAAAVLLLSLGSDYNIFAVGRVWQLARDRSLREAMRVGVPQSTRAITSAGLALAASFGLLALVPLRPFRELGFVLAAGILIDVFVVRALLVPALLTLVGPVSGWPSRRLRARAAAR